MSVYGKVQRVGFRYFVQNIAMNLNISGFVKNMPDGSVYIEAEGTEKEIAEFVDHCKKGPDWSEVRDVKITEMPAVDYNDFNIKY